MGSAFRNRWGKDGKIAIVWEYKSTATEKLKTLDLVEFWASNNNSGRPGHSQAGIFGIIGNSAYELDLRGLPRQTQKFTTIKNGKYDGSARTFNRNPGRETPLSEFDSVCLWIRARASPGFQAACQGYRIEYTVARKVASRL